MDYEWVASMVNSMDNLTVETMVDVKVVLWVLPKESKLAVG